MIELCETKPSLKYFPTPEYFLLGKIGLFQFTIVTPCSYVQLGDVDALFLCTWQVLCADEENLRPAILDSLHQLPRIVVCGTFRPISGKDLSKCGLA